MSELDGILALLLFVAAGIVWLAMEAKRIRDALEPLASSRLARALAEV